MISRYHIIRTEEELDKLIQACKTTGYASVDFETNAKPMYNHDFCPTILSVTFQAGSGCSIPLKHFEMPAKHQNRTWKEWLTKFGREVIEDPNIVKIAWNWKFDNQIFVKYGIYSSGTVIDGILAKYLLNEHRPNGLKDMVRKYLPQFADYENSLKDEQESSKVKWESIPLEELSKYGCLDTDCTMRLTIFLEKKLMDLDMYYILRNLYMPMSRVLQDTERNGLYLDREFNQKLLVEYKPKMEKALETIYNLPKMAKIQKIYTENRVESYIQKLVKEIEEIRAQEGYSKKVQSRETRIANVRMGIFSNNTERELHRQINLKSNNDLKWLLYSEEGFKFPVLKNSESGAPSTDEETLTNLRLKIKNPESPKAIFLDSLLSLRGLQKMYTTYIQGWSEKVQDDSRLHGKYHIFGTESNRLSSSDPNLQQVPKTSVDPNIKKQLKAPEGQLYFVMDFSQCIDGEAYIFCDTGLKKLKDIIPGKDKICLVDPQWVNHSRTLDIKTLANKGKAECLKLTTNTGRELILTKDHPVKSTKGFTKAQDLKMGDTLYIESMGLSKRVGKVHIPTDEAYIAGFFYGDGHYPQERSQNRKESDRSIYFSTGLDRGFFKPMLEKFFKCRFNNPQKISQGIQGHSSLVLEFRKKYPKIDSHHMTIPASIMEADWETKMHFIGGQIDSDGSIGSGRFRYTSVCKEYILQLQLLFQSVGFHGIIRTTSVNQRGKTFVAHHLIVQSTSAISRLKKYLRLPRKIDRANQCLYNKRGAAPANKSSHCPTQRIPLEVYRDLGRTPEFHKTYRNSLRKGRLIHSTLQPYLNDLVKLDSRWLDAYWYKFEQIIKIEEAGEREVYDLEVDKLHEFNPNGIRVHNCELRMMAHLSKDETYLKAFAEGADPHLAIAAQKYGVPYEEVKAISDDEHHPDHKLWKNRRKQAKQIAFGLIYGIQAKLLSTKLSDPKEGLIVTPEEAQEMMDDYFAQHPAIKKFAEKQEKILRRDGYLTSLFGTRRRLPEIYSDDPREVAYALRLSLNYPCLLPTSQALSKTKGWVNYENLEIGDEILAFNRDLGKSEWQKVERVNVFDYNGDMIRLKTKHLDVLSTPDHRWVVTKPNKISNLKNTQVLTSEELYNSTNPYAIPIRAPHHNLNKEKYSDVYVAFLGWYLTDGSLRNGHTVKICQSNSANPHKVQIIDSIFEELGVSFTRKEKNQVVWEVREPGFVYELNKLVPDRKLNMRLLTQLTNSQLGILLENMRLGDGWSVWATGDKEQGELLQALVVLCNNTSSMYELSHEGDISYFKDHKPSKYGQKLIRATKTSYGVKFSNYRKSVNTKNTYNEKNNLSKEKYTGKVWCPTVHSGAFFTRVVGDDNRYRTIITGNCQSPASNMTQFGSVLQYWDMKRGKFPPMPEVATVHDAVYYNTDPKYINVYTIWKFWDTFRNPDTQDYFGFQIDDVDMEMDFSIGRSMAEELPFIPGYDYSKMLSPEFNTEEYMEEHKKYRDIQIRDYPKVFPELFKKGKRWKKLK